MKIDILYRRVTNNDIIKVQSLFNDIFKKKLSQKYYKWKYFHNNKYYGFIAIVDNKIVGHVAYNINEINIKNKIILCAFRHTSMVSNKVRKIGVYKELMIKSLDTIKNDKINAMIIWPNKNNLIPSMKILNYFTVFSSPYLFLKIKGQKLKFSTSKYNLKHLNLNNTKKLKLKKIKSNSIFWGINKNVNYLIKRYFQDSENKYYYHEIKIKNIYSLIIFKIFNDKVYIMEFISSELLYDIHLKKFINIFREYKITLHIFCNIHSPLYKILILNNFLYSKRIYNCGLSLISKNVKTNQLINNLSYYNYSMGDTDVF